MKIVEPQEDRVEPGVQGGDREVLGPGQALAPTAARVENHVAGLPFPKIDPNDPQVALQDHVELRATSRSSPTTSTCATSTPTPAPSADGKALTVERHFILDHLRRLFYTGRLYVDPKPVLSRTPTASATSSRSIPILEPFDLKGVGFLSYPLPRPRQPGRHLALPAEPAPRAPALVGAALGRALRPGHRRRQLRRLRRPARLVGLEAPRREEDRSASLHAENFPVKWAEGGGDFVFDDVWEKRDVWVVEGVVEAAAVRLREARHLHRQGDVRRPLLRHLRPRRPALEGVDQPVRLPQAGRSRRATIEYTRRDAVRPSDRRWSTCSSSTRPRPRCRARASRARRAATSTSRRRERPSRSSSPSPT